MPACLPNCQGLLPPSSPAEIISEKRSNPAVRVFGRLSIVLVPVAEVHLTGLEAGCIERMMSTGVCDELNGWSQCFPSAQVSARNPFVQSSSSPTRMSVGMLGQAPAKKHGG